MYCGKIKICDEIDYTSLDTWDILINKEIELTGSIDILMKFLDKVKYPVSYIDTNGENCYLAIAAVLKDGRFADEIMEYVSEKGGREGLVSMIKHMLN
ncbi:hypothetical protein JQ038_05245 [Clostridium botulinum]|nr:hypothetical protein [Clostridium botulinum]MCS4482172.1 hypothetical protein [Clostridium botulinum]